MAVKKPRGRAQHLRWAEFKREVAVTTMPCPHCRMRFRPFTMDCWRCKLYNQLTPRGMMLVENFYNAHKPTAH